MNNPLTHKKTPDFPTIIFNFNRILVIGIISLYLNSIDVSIADLELTSKNLMTKIFYILCRRGR